MWNDIKEFLGLGKSSRETAKGRLLLVLAHDRTGLDGAKLQELRAEIAEVIGRYVNVDTDALEIRVEQLSRESSTLQVTGPLRQSS